MGEMKRKMAFCLRVAAEMMDPRDAIESEVEGAVACDHDIVMHVNILTTSDDPSEVAEQVKLHLGLH